MTPSPAPASPNFRKHAEDSTTFRKHAEDSTTFRKHAEDSTNSTSFPRNRYWIFGGILAAALAWDLWTKWWVFQELGFPHRPAQWQWQTPLLWGRFSITLFTSFNNGALWGLGQGYAWLFALLSVAASALVCYILFIRGAARSLWLTIALALIGSGALGNLYDRMYLHNCRDVNGVALTGVRDFIKCDLPGIDLQNRKLIESWEWPIFNFADSFLVTGAIMLILQALFTRESATATAGSGATRAAESGLPPQTLAASVGPWRSPSHGSPDP